MKIILPTSGATADQPIGRVPEPMGWFIDDAPSRLPADTELTQRPWPTAHRRPTCHW
ncbi:hypothetical protein GCM10022222_70930 [Amycolatopsis ultiminotia]|uniref:Uncharacterized protein n=1 Tax=Amycolatopsis ultiminotia TaxID=543629 RepID=A0ABP6Y3U6_9PSEU